MIWWIIAGDGASGMKRLASIFVLLSLLPAAAQQVISSRHRRGGLTIVTPAGSSAGCTAAIGGTGTPTVSCTLTAVAGQMVLVDVAGFNGSTTTPTLADSGSYAAITAASGFPHTNSIQHDMVWTVTGMSSGSHTLTVTFSTNQIFITLLAPGFMGASSSPIDSLEWNSATQSSPLVCSNVTTSYNGELLGGFNEVFAGATLTPGTTPQTMTTRQGPANNQIAVTGTAATAGSNHQQFTYSGSNPVACSTFALH